MDTKGQQRLLKVVITGAAGKIAQSIIPMLCSGEIFGNEFTVDLSLLDLEEKMDELEGFTWELQDCNFKQVRNIDYGHDPAIMFQNAQLAIFLGGISRRPGMTREYLINVNCQIYRQHGIILNEVADKDCKVLVVANPTNTNCMILSHYAPNIPKNNFTCLTRLDLNRTKAEIKNKIDCCYSDIQQLIVWGNHSYTIYPDTTFCTVKGKPIAEIVDDEFLKKELIQKVQKRGSTILMKKQSSAVISGVYAIMNHLQDWYFGNQDWVNMGVISDGQNYQIEKDICISMPVKCKNFEYQVIEQELNSFQKQQISLTVNELISEKKSIFEIIEQL